MKLRTKITIGVLIGLFVFCNIIAFTQKAETETTKCGTVIDNFTELTNIKHGTRTDYYLKIQYANYSAVEEVSAQTFYNYHKVGSSICLSETTHNIGIFIVMCITFGIWSFMIFMTLVFTIKWLFGYPFDLFN